MKFVCRSTTIPNILVLLKHEKKLQEPYLFEKKGAPAIVYIPIPSKIWTIDLYARDAQLREELYSTVVQQWEKAKLIIEKLLLKIHENKN